MDQLIFIIIIIIMFTRLPSVRHGFMQLRFIHALPPHLLYILPPHHIQHLSILLTLSFLLLVFIVEVFEPALLVVLCLLMLTLVPLIDHTNL